MTILYVEITRKSYCILYSKSHFIPLSENIGLWGIVSMRWCQDKRNRWSPPGYSLKRGSDRHISTSQSTQPYTVQIHRKHALIWYDTPTGRTCKAMHIPVLGLIDKSTSVINTNSLPRLYSVGMLGSIFDICWKKKKEWEDRNHTWFYIFRFYDSNQIGYVIYILILKKQSTMRIYYTFFLYDMH